MPTQDELSEKIIAELKQIFDPEIPINIYDLGFIYSVDINEDKVHIQMTLTVPGCPMHQILTREVKERIGKVEGVSEVEVELTFEPRWSVERISEEGKQKLREMGYRI